MNYIIKYAKLEKLLEMKIFEENKIYPTTHKPTEDNWKFASLALFTEKG